MDELLAKSLCFSAIPKATYYILSILRTSLCRNDQIICPGSALVTALTQFPRGARWAGRTQPLFWASHRVYLRGPRGPPRTPEAFLVHMYERTLSKCYSDTSFNCFPSETLTHRLATKSSVWLFHLIQQIPTGCLILLYLTLSSHQQNV